MNCSKEVTLFDFGGPLSFGAAADLGHHVRERSKGRAALILDFTRVPFLDVSSARAVETIGTDAKAVNKRVFISGMNEQQRQVLSALGSDAVLPEGAFFEKRIDAVRAAHDFINDQNGSNGSLVSGSLRISPNPA